MAERRIICGIDGNYYVSVHKWLRCHFGSANKCQNEACKGISTIYEYALKKGCEYEKKRDNFLTLCRSCHQKYDFVEEKRKYLRVFTDERKRRIGASRKGKYHSEEFKQFMSDRMSGSQNPMYGVSVKGVEHHFYGKTHTEETRRILSQSNGKFSPEEIEEIRKLHAIGVPQNKIAIKFGSSKASICRIVNNKRYKSW